MIGWVNTPGIGGVAIQKNKPVIHVNALLGSTIDFIYIPSAKSFPNVDGKTADYYYSCPSIGTWTVTATLGTDTVSDTITINNNKQYDVYISQNLYFIKNGQILIPKATYRSGSQEALIEQVDGAVKVSYQGSAQTAGVVWQISQDLLSRHNYTKLIANVRSWSGATSYNTHLTCIGIYNSNVCENSPPAYTAVYGETFPGELIVNCANIFIINKYAGIRVAETGARVAFIEDFYLAK